MKTSLPIFEPENAASNQAIREDINLRHPSLNLDEESREEFGKKFNQLTRKDLIAFWHILDDRYSTTEEQGLEEQILKLKALLKTAESERDTALAERQEAEAQLKQLRSEQAESKPAPEQQEAASSSNDETEALQAELREAREQLAAMSAARDEARELLGHNNEAMSTLAQVKAIIGVSPEAEVLSALSEKLNNDNSQVSGLQNEVKILRRELLQVPGRTSKLAWACAIFLFICTSCLSSLSLCGISINHIHRYPWLQSARILFNTSQPWLNSARELFLAAPSAADYHAVSSYHKAASTEGGMRAFAFTQEGVKLFPQNAELWFKLGELYLDGFAPKGLSDQQTYIKAGECIMKAAELNHETAGKLSREFKDAAANQAN